LYSVDRNAKEYGASKCCQSIGIFYRETLCLYCVLKYRRSFSTINADKIKWDPFFECNQHNEAAFFCSQYDA
jgi:hypothetical protein